jgi:4-oxalocrotonate tautomerase
VSPIKENKMPNITFDGPRIEDLAQKRELIKTVTDAAVKAYGLPKQAMVILIQENDPENVGIGGELLVDRAKGKEP